MLFIDGNIFIRSVYMENKDAVWMFSGGKLIKLDIDCVVKRTI